MTAWKLRVFNTVITIQVLYGLDTTWLVKGDLKRLDADQTQWLQQNMHILSAYYSRVTDETVRERSQQAKWSTITQRQLVLYGHIQSQSKGVERHVLYRSMVQPRHRLLYGGLG